MKSSRIIGAASLATAMAMAVFALPARAQTSTTSPIVVKKSATQGPKSTWMSAEVVHADSNSMIVREQQNGMMIHTFTYAPSLQAHMQKVADNGGYQYGDKV